MDRLFLDANVLFSAAYRPSSGLGRFWKLKGVVLCSSHYAVEEARINLSEEAQRRRLASLSAQLELFDAIRQALPPSLSLPDKDLPILLAAMNARTTHLITGDIRHFGSYLGKRLAGILILTPSAYLRGTKHP
jgi:hypothetical protein